MSWALLPLVAIAAGLLLTAGVAKLRAPAPAAAALEGLGMPASVALARCLGALEAGVGGAALLSSAAPAMAALGALYLLLTGAALRLRRAADGVGCGCFGEDSTPAHIGHAIQDATCAAVAAAALLARPAAPLSILAAGPGAVALALGVACGVYLAIAIIKLLPASWRAYSRQVDAAS